MASSEAELTYFRGRGLAEVIRLVLTYTETPYHEVNLKTREDYLKLVPDLLFEQVPLLRIDGLNLVQSGTIVRYLARKNKLYGANDTEATRIDLLFDGTRDFLRAFNAIGFAASEEEAKKDLVDKTFPRYLRVFNQVLSETGTGYLVGSSVTLADLGLLEVLLATVDYFTTEQLKDYEHLQAFYNKLTGDARVVKYVNGVRKPKNDPELLTEVKAILSHLKF